jgi:hypothetical protein
VKLREFIRRMTKIFAIYKRLQELEAAERTRLSWLARLWRRYQKPSVVALNKLSELRAENILDVIEDAMQGSLANKYQEKFRRDMNKASLKNVQASKAKPLNTSSVQVSAQSGRQQVASTASRAPAAAAAAAAAGGSATAAQHTPAIRKNKEFTDNSLSPNSKHRKDAAYGSGIGASSEPAVSIQRSSEFELEEVIVHCTASSGSEGQDRWCVSTESSPPPSPPPESLLDSVLPPSNAPARPASSPPLPTAANPPVNFRAILTNASSSTAESKLDETEVNTSLQVRIGSPPPISGSLQLIPKSSHSVTSSGLKPPTEQSKGVLPSVSPHRRPADILATAAAIASSAATPRVAALQPPKMGHAPSRTTVQSAVSHFLPRAPAVSSFTIRHGSPQGKVVETSAQLDTRLPTRPAANERKKNGRLDQA